MNCEEENDMKYFEEENEEEFYSKESILELTENDEIDSSEEGFMLGYMGV